MPIIFADVKSRVPITAVLAMLNMETKPEKDQLRAACPVCAPDDPRSLVITPEKSLWYCFPSKVGGDQISLYGHVKTCTMRVAAEAIDMMPKPPEPPKPEPKKGFDAQKYLEGLQPVEGLPEALCKQVGIGRATKGAHAGKVVVALRDQTGTILVFASVTDLKLPNKW